MNTESINQLDVAQFLRDALDAKIKANPQYSMRTFAKKLGLSPGGVSLILSRKKRLSVDRAHEVARALNLSEQERTLFILLAQIQNTKSNARKSDLIEVLRSAFPEQEPIRSLELEQFKLISAWYGLPILEAITHFGEMGTPRLVEVQLAKQFKLKRSFVVTVLECLVRLELIEVTPLGYRRITQRILVDAAFQPEAVKSCYQGLLEQCSEHLNTGLPQDRSMGAEVFAMDLMQMDQVRKLTDQYLKDLRQLAKQGKERTHIVQALSAVFTLTHNFKSELSAEHSTQISTQLSTKKK